MKKFLKYIHSLMIILIINQSVFAQNCVGTAGQVKWSYWTGFASSPDSSDLFALETFPSRPDGSQTLGYLKSPVNYADYFASVIRGYIKVPTTDTYIFNITGDDKSIFFLSTNDSPANKIKRSEISTYSGLTEYNKEAGQTSQNIQLVGGQYYYFELYNFEGSGGDYVSLQWRKASETTVVWSIIDFNYIYEYACGQNCPPRGTACNDGSTNTTNDQQDGFCNCVGTAPAPNNCVGDKGLIEAYYYDNITGNYVENDLINAAKFPLSPDRREKLKGAYGPLTLNAKDNYGTLVQGFLTVPITGIYDFNLTGDNQTFFFLSSDDKIANKQARQALVFYGIEDTEHKNSVFQSIGPLLMEKGKYYYFEFRHKESSSRDHFNLYWKTPFHEIRQWKRIPNFYLFDYKCEISCIAQNTPCNDDNPFTKNDKIDTQCNCIGTPCSGPDCDDETARYQAFDSCDPTNNLSTLKEAAWVSCTNSLNPNPNTARASSAHWIKYDFTDRYKFSTSRVWNYNVENETDKGFKTVTIDYSTDGTTWQALGNTYSWPKAQGLPDYSGFAGPNFNDIKARFILISAIENWGAGCSGLGKVAFDALICNPSGTPCNDNDPLTSYDKFDNNCNCKGVNINCGSDTLKLTKETLASGAFKAKKRIEAQSLVPTTKDISFTAGNSIVLLPGFEVNSSAIFKADITDCIQAAFVANQKATAPTDSSEFSTKDTEISKMKEIVFRINQPSYVKLSLKDSKDQLIVILLDYFSESIGTQTKNLPTNKLAKGTYFVELELGDKKLRQEFVIDK